MKMKKLLCPLFLLAFSMNAQAQTLSDEPMDERFNDNTLPYGWYAKGWEVKDGVAQKKAEGFSMGMPGSSSSSFDYLLTPPLNNSGFRSIVFKAKKAASQGMGSMMGDSDSTFVVEYEKYSEHRWKLAGDFTTELTDEYQEFTLPDLEKGVYRFRFRAASNVNIDSVAGLRIDLEAPDILVLRDSVESTPNVNLGLCLKDSVVKFLVVNTATGTLNTNITVYDDQPFKLSETQLSVAAGDTVDVDLTYLYAQSKPGRNMTLVSFVPTDERVYSVNYEVSAAAPEKGVWNEDFKANTQPKGWFTEGWQFTEQTASIIKPSDGKEGMMGGSSPSYFLITPVLTVDDANQTLAFSAKTTGSSGMGSMFGGGGSTFSIEKSVYGSNRWERVRDLTSEVDTLYNTLWVSDLAPGDYRFRFLATDSIVIDSVAGFKMKETAPDLYVTSDKMRFNRLEFGTQSANATETFFVINTGNSPLKADIASSNEIAFVVSDSHVEVAPGDTAKVTVAFKYSDFIRGEMKSVITVTPTDEILLPQSFTVSAYTISQNSWSENFEPEYVVEDESVALDIPAEWETTGWTVSKPSSGGMMAMFGMGGGEEKSWMATTESEDYELITPSLQAYKGEVLEFYADMSSGGGMMAMFGMGGGSGQLNVYYNLGYDDEWKLYGTFTESGKVYFVAPYTGVYRLKFKGSSVALDDFVGFRQPLTTIALVEGMDEQNTEVLNTYYNLPCNVSYNRILKAEKKDNTTWTPKAYSLCLPYYMDFRDYDNPGEVKLYTLSYVDRYYHQFIFKETIPEIGQGKPYLAVVTNDSVRLDACGVFIDNRYQEDVNVKDFEDYFVKDEITRMGYFVGTYSSIETTDPEAENIFGLVSDGTWGRLSKADQHIPQFRAYFKLEEGVSIDGDEYRLNRANSTGDKPFATKFFMQSTEGNQAEKVADMPNLLFSGDLTFGGSEVTGIQPTIQTIDADGTRRYFDLQGRQLNEQPKKGVYIMNGKKYIK